MQLANAPAQLVEAWATSDSTKTNPIPVPSQIGVTPGAASWTDGFPPLCAEPLISGGVPPSKADMNGALYQMSAVDVWICAGGGFPYNATFSSAIGGYPKGARVLMASGNGYWVSTVDNNISDPDTGGAGWASASENAITALTGDVIANGPGSATATLSSTGVTAGSYVNASITVDVTGRITSASSGAAVPSGDLGPNGANTRTIGGGPYQNTNASPIMIEGFLISTAGGAAGVYSISRGSTSSLGTTPFNTQLGASQANDDCHFSILIPAGWWYQLEASGSANFSMGSWFETVMG